jgi:hypothetical protein
VPSGPIAQVQALCFGAAARDAPHSGWAWWALGDWLAGRNRQDPVQALAAVRGGQPPAGGMPPICPAELRAALLGNGGPPPEGGGQPLAGGGQLPAGGGAPVCPAELRAALLAFSRQAAIVGSSVVSHGGLGQGGWREGEGEGGEEGVGGGNRCLLSFTCGDLR